jgi:hypothetical protein
MTSKGVEAAAPVVIPGRVNASRECASDDRLRANPESVATIVIPGRA